VHEPEEKKKAFPWPMLAVLAAAAVGMWAWGHRKREQAPAQPTVSQPAAPQPAGGGAIAAGDVGALSRALDGDAPLPQHFVLRGLNFTKDSADIEPGTARVLDDVAGALKAHPHSRIRLEGHTDATGAPDANKALSQERAQSTKQYLTGQGVDASRIETVGYGSTRPIDSNDTPEGRAENRRTELVVLER
jgi:outer membrane protein OmpA-like peptidoglycan-associated protein